MTPGRLRSEGPCVTRQLELGIKWLKQNLSMLVPQSPTSVVLTDQKRTAQILRASHVYTVANFVAS